MPEGKAPGWTYSPLAVHALYMTLYVLIWRHDAPIDIPPLSPYPEDMVGSSQGIVVFGAGNMLDPVGGREGRRRRCFSRRARSMP